MGEHAGGTMCALGMQIRRFGFQPGMILEKSKIYQALVRTGFPNRSNRLEER
jgi:hypothetical protein